MQTRIHLLQKTFKEETNAIKKELQVHISAQKLDQNCVMYMLCMILCFLNEIISHDLQCCESDFYILWLEHLYYLMFTMLLMNGADSGR